MSKNKKKKPAVPQAQGALNQYKNEVAAEVGVNPKKGKSDFDEDRAGSGKLKKSNQVG